MHGKGSALSEAFPLIAAGVLVIIGVVLFVTVLWPDSGTSERPVAPVAAPSAAPAATAEPPLAPPAPPPTAAVAPATSPPVVTSPAPAAEPTPEVASPPAPIAAAAPPTAPAEKTEKPPAQPNAIVEAAIAGNDAEVQALVKKLGSQRATRGDRARARDFNAKALTHVRKGRYADAVPLFEAANQADSGDPEIRENLGYALLKAGRIDEAESALLAALEIGPQRASTWGSLGFVYAKRGQHAEAVKLILTAYRFAPDRKKAAETYRRQAKTETDPKVRATLEDVVKHLPR